MTSPHSPAAPQVATPATPATIVVQYGEVRDIPLNRLKASSKNVRKVGHRAEVIEARAASITYKGVLQPLVVEPEIKGGRETGYYLVSAGEGRRQALRLLAKRKRLANGAPVRCVVDTTNDPAEVSMDENFSRESLHPADEFEAFRDLAERKGYSAEEISARFGPSPDTVRKRLRLGAAAPALLDLYREAVLTLDQLMAFAVNPDQDRQMQVYAQLPAQSRQPYAIRRAMTETKVAADDRRLRFIGLDAYVAAGGPVLRDLFTDTFNRYLDSGFGLLGGEVAFLSTTLVAIDVTLAALFWAWAQGEDILARLVKKTLYVGFFAFLIGNFQTLSLVVLKSFSGLGLKATGAGISAEDFLRPGRLAALGVSSCKPLLEAAAELGGFPGFFENIVQIVILLVVALLVIVAFFIIAIQVFVVLIEFKLVTLAGFVLVPFGLFGRTAFLAEKVLGNVIASGVKVMVLAVIVGIGSSLFAEFNDAASGQPTLEEVLAIALAALTLLGLSVFGPGVASGLVSGAPQLGAGAAVGTGLMVGGMAMAGAAAVQMVTAGAGAGASGASAAAAGAAGGRPPPTGGAPTSGGPPNGPPPSGPAGGAAAAAPSTPPPPPTGDPGDESGGGGGGQGEGSGPPPWAQRLQHRQDLAHGASMAVHAVGSGDNHSAGAAPRLSED